MGVGKKLLAGALFVGTLSGCYESITHREEVQAAIAAGMLATQHIDLPPESPEGIERVYTTICPMEKPNCDPPDALVTSYSEGNKIPVTLDRISQTMLDATVSIEDPDFYSRGSKFDWNGKLRAFVINIKNQELAQGGTTIPEGLVQNLYPASYPNHTTPHSQQTDTQKIEDKGYELGIAQTLNSGYQDEAGRNEILQRYETEINFGRGAYGVEAMAQVYFNKHAAELDLAQSSTAARIPQSPDFFDGSEDPVKDAEQMQNLTEGRNTVLEAMVKNGKASRTDADRIEQIPIQHCDDPSAPGAPEGCILPYRKFPYGPSQDTHLADFLQLRPAVDGVMQEVAARGITEPNVRRDLAINTTFSTVAQAAMIDAMVNKVQYPQDGRMVAGVLIEKSGAIRAMRGGDFSIFQGNLTTTQRLNGSMLKVWWYLYLVSKGYIGNMGDQIEDPQNFIWPAGNSDGTDYTPSGNNVCSSDGDCTGNEAFYRSENWIILNQYLRLQQQGINGLEEARKMMESFGLTSPTPVVPSNILGTAELSLLQNAQAINSLLNNGATYAPEHSLDSIYSFDTKQNLYTFQPFVPTGQLVDQNAVNQIANAMRSVIRDPHGTAHKRFGDFPGDAMAKTGTAAKNGSADENGADTETYIAAIQGAFCLNGIPYAFAFSEGFPDGYKPLGKNHNGGDIPAAVADATGRALNPTESCGLPG